MKKIAYEEMFKNEMTHFWYVSTRNLMIDLLKGYLKKDAKILDCGCGTGGTIVHLQRAGFKNITGVDNSKEALKFTKKRKLANIKLASVNSLPFSKNSFDVVICLDVLYHQGVNPQKALGEFRRVLKTGGILYLQEPSYNWLKSRHDKVIETENRFTRLTIRKLVSGAGLKILKLSYLNSILSLPIIAKRLKDKFFSDHESSDVYRLHPIVNKSLFLVMSFERKLIKNLDLPFGLSIICIAKK